MRRLLTLTAMMLLAASMQAISTADSAAGAAPFTPPSGWRPVPSGVLPELLLSWTHGTSSFGVTRIAMPIDSGQLWQALHAGSSAVGTEISSSSDPVCGAPAARITLKTEDGKEILTQQMQSLDGATFVSVYRRPLAAESDHAIDAFMSSFCGSKSLAQVQPPPSWRTLNAKLIGVWFSPRGPTETIAALSRDPKTSSESWASFAVSTSINASALTIISSKTGTLCGNPAFFYTAEAKPRGVPPIELHLAATQTASASYMVLYSHPKSTTADPAALSSLATLCASQPAAHPAQ